MALTITGITPESFPEHGWGIVGERLGDASTEILGMVLPLDKREIAGELAGSFQKSNLGGLSWFTIRVSRFDGVRTDEDGRPEASYVEASDLSQSLN